ncbi:hypothetical protein SUNI508_13877 [Seiridium unicorne]|uniref:DUF6604 domain-containing protein n=1 Tax=Seiridium unicorne TaxID=138068 RepID=A0ABR2VAN6_9PEZI
MVRHDGVAIINQYKSNEAEFKDWLDAETQRHGFWPRSRSGLRSLEEQVQFLGFQPPINHQSHSKKNIANSDAIVSSLRNPVDVPPRSVSHLRLAIQGRQQSQESHGYIIGVLEWALDVLEPMEPGRPQSRTPSLSPSPASRRRSAGGGSRSPYCCETRDDVRAGVVRKRRTCPARVDGFEDWQYPLPDNVDLDMDDLVEEFSTVTEMLGVRLDIVSDRGRAVAVEVGYPTRSLPYTSWAGTVIDAERMRAFAWLVEFLQDYERVSRLPSARDSLEFMLEAELGRDEIHIRRLTKDERMRRAGRSATDSEDERNCGLAHADSDSTIDNM